MNAVEVLNLTNAMQQDADAILGNDKTAEAKPAFHIESDGAADWYLKQLACYDAEISLLRTQAEAAIKRVQSDKDSLTNLYGAELEAYIGQKLAEDKRGRKSIILPHGTCAFRTVPQSLRVVDDNAALECVKGEPVEQDVTRRVLMRDAYLRWAKEERDETGEILPGVEIVEERESFSIRFGKEKES